MYKEDLPSQCTCEAELHWWRISWQCTDVEDVPDTAAKVRKSCNPEHYPYVYALLKIVCTLPITTSCSISVIWRLKKFLIATMGQERISSLALIHIHYNAPLNTAEIINRFARMYPSKMAL